MRIEKGNVFICEKDYFMDKGDLAYIRGKIYTSNKDDYLPSEIYQKHRMEINSKFNEHFTRIVDTDPINPNHYKRGNEYEPIKIIQHYNLSFELGNVIKYVLRCDSKGKREEDLKKAMRYLQYELDKIK